MMTCLILLLPRHLQKTSLIFISCNEHHSVILHLHTAKYLRNSICIPTVIESKVIKTNTSCYNLCSQENKNKKNCNPYIVIIKICTTQGFQCYHFFCSQNGQIIVTVICYTNFYLIPFKFVACPAGFWGLNCSAKCNVSSYGLGCAERCVCDPCHHVFGCNLTMYTRGKDDQIRIKQS